MDRDMNLFEEPLFSLDTPLTFCGPHTYEKPLANEWLKQECLPSHLLVALLFLLPIPCPRDAMVWNL